MRVLVVDDEQKAKVANVLEFATKPENYYLVGKGGFSFQKAPGEDPRHVCYLPVGYRCVFSITKTTADGKLWRHLSISVPSAKKYPAVFAGLTIAELFGFTGWDGKSEVLPATWILHVDKKDHCVVLGQEYHE